MFNLTQMTVVVFMKSGNKIRFKCKSATYKCTSEGYASYQIVGSPTNQDILLSQIEAVRFIQPWWIRIIRFVTH